MLADIDLTTAYLRARISFDKDHNVYVVDTRNNSIQTYCMR